MNGNMGEESHNRKSSHDFTINSFHSGVNECKAGI